jgi:hypothetical protein
MAVGADKPLANVDSIKPVGRVAATVAEQQPERIRKTAIHSLARSVLSTGRLRREINFSRLPRKPIRPGVVRSLTSMRVVAEVLSKLQLNGVFLKLVSDNDEFSEPTWNNRDSGNPHNRLTRVYFAFRCKRGRETGVGRKRLSANILLP